MKLIKMTLENFQGIKNFTFSPYGRDCSIYGENGTGKTTLYNAFTWLLYGKSSTDEKNYTPKTTDCHNLNHVVTAVIEQNGKQMELKKDFHEVYSTKRGSSEKTFKGHTSEFFVDGVPMAEKEYQKKIDEICPTELIKLLTRYDYFCEEMKVADRRNLLLEICGDISDEYVMQSYDEFKDLLDILDGHTVNEYRSIVKRQKSEIDKELKLIPARIDEAEKGKPEIDGNEDDAKKEIASLEAERNELSKKRALLTSTAEAEIRSKIAELKAQKLEAETEHDRKEKEKNKDIEEEIEKLKEKRFFLNCEISDKKEKAEDNERRKYNAEKERTRLLEHWQKVNDEEFSGDTVCTTCGQALPEEQVEEARKTFNLEKSKKLEEITENGKAVSKDIISGYENNIEKLEKEIKDMKEQVSDVENQITDLFEKKSDKIPFETTEKCKELVLAIGGEEKKLSDVKESTKEMEQEIVTQIDEINLKIEKERSIIANAELVKRQDKRIVELRERQKKLGVEFEKIKKGEYLCDLFVRRKAEMLDDKVNSKFKTLQFRLFQEQVNGGIADDCEPLIPCGDLLVPFKSANNASRINAGLEVVDVLSEHYGVQLPIFIDNAESVTEPIETDCQQIRLYVSKDDKVLRVE